jgi:hypothetical protein
MAWHDFAWAFVPVEPGRGAGIALVVALLVLAVDRLRRKPV